MMIGPHSQQHTALNRDRVSNRRGITLLELMIALGLGILLIASVGATLMITLRTESSGRQRMERAQLVRALYLRMSDDLSAVTYLKEQTSDDDDEELTAAEDADQSDLEAELGITELEDFLSPPDAIGIKTTGLYGDESALVFYIQRPERLPPRVASQTTAEDDEIIDSVTDSGLRSVSWFLNGDSSLGSLLDSSSFVTGDLSDFSFDTDSGGISRLEEDAFEVTTAEDPLELLSWGVQSLAPEVIDLKFRYFDGLDWQTEWDSALQERLPNAVEVTLTFEERQDSSQPILFGEDPSSLGSDTVRFVVALTMAPPPMMEMEL